MPRPNDIGNEDCIHALSSIFMFKMLSNVFLLKLSKSPEKN